MNPLHSNSKQHQNLLVHERTFEGHITFARNLLREIKINSNWQINDVSTFLIQKCYEARNTFSTKEIEWILSIVTSTFCFSDSESTMHPFVKIVEMIHKKQLTFKDAIELLKIVSLVCNNLSVDDKKNCFSSSIIKKDNGTFIILGYEWCFLHLSLDAGNDLNQFAFRESLDNSLDIFINGLQSFLLTYVITNNPLQFKNQSTLTDHTDENFNTKLLLLLKDSHPIKSFIGILLNDYSQDFNQSENQLAAIVKSLITIFSSEISNEWKFTLVNLLRKIKNDCLRSIADSLYDDHSKWIGNRNELSYHLINLILKSKSTDKIAKLLYLELIDEINPIESDLSNRLVFAHPIFPFSEEIEILKNLLSSNQISIHIIFKALTTFGKPLCELRHSHVDKSKSIENLCSITFQYFNDLNNPPIATFPVELQHKLGIAILSFCHYFLERNEPLKSALLLNRFLSVNAISNQKKIVTCLYAFLSELFTCSYPSAIYLQSPIKKLFQIEFLKKKISTKNQIKFYLRFCNALLLFKHSKHCFKYYRYSDSPCTLLVQDMNFYLKAATIGREQNADLEFARELLSELNKMRMNGNDTKEFLNLISLFPSQYENWKIDLYVNQQSKLMNLKTPEQILALLIDSMMSDNEDLKYFRKQLLEELSKMTTGKWNASLLSETLSIIESLIRKYYYDDAHTLLLFIKNKRGIDQSRFSKIVKHLIYRSEKHQETSFLAFFHKLKPQDLIELKEFIEFKTDKTRDISNCRLKINLYEKLKIKNLTNWLHNLSVLFQSGDKTCLRLSWKGFLYLLKENAFDNSPMLYEQMICLIIDSLQENQYFEDFSTFLDQSTILLNTLCNDQKKKELSLKILVIGFDEVKLRKRKKGKLQLASKLLTFRNQIGGFDDVHTVDLALLPFWCQLNKESDLKLTCKLLKDYIARANPENQVMLINGLTSLMNRISPIKHLSSDFVSLFRTCHLTARRKKFDLFHVQSLINNCVTLDNPINQLQTIKWIYYYIIQCKKNPSCNIQSLKQQIILWTTRFSKNTHIEVTFCFIRFFSEDMIIRLLNEKRCAQLLQPLFCSWLKEIKLEGKILEKDSVFFKSFSSVFSLFQNQSNALSQILDEMIETFFFLAEKDYHCKHVVIVLDHLAMLKYAIICKVPINSIIDAKAMIIHHSIWFKLISTEFNRDKDPKYINNLLDITYTRVCILLVEKHIPFQEKLNLIDSYFFSYFPTNRNYKNQLENHIINCNHVLNILQKEHTRECKNNPKFIYKFYLFLNRCTDFSTLSLEAKKKIAFDLINYFVELPSIYAIRACSEIFRLFLTKAPLETISSITNDFFETVIDKINNIDLKAVLFYSSLEFLPVSCSNQAESNNLTIYVSQWKIFLEFALKNYHVPKIKKDKLYTVQFNLLESITNNFFQAIKNGLFHHQLPHLEFSIKRLFLVWGMFDVKMNANYSIYVFEKYFTPLINALHENELTQIVKFIEPFLLRALKKYDQHSNSTFLHQLISLLDESIPTRSNFRKRK